MWKCPDCDKEFKNINQNHSCGETPASVDEYIAAQSEAVQPILNKVREAIRAAAPDAVEKMSYQMPTFWQHENLIHFAAFKNHIGIYPGALDQLPAELIERLAPYKTSKGAIQLPLSEPIDFTLIADITRWRVTCVSEDR